MDETISCWVTEGDLYRLSFLDQAKCQQFRYHAPEWLINAFDGGYLCVAKWLQNTYSLSSDEIDVESIMYMLAEDGQTQAAQWLCSTYNITLDNIDSIYYPSFMQACSYGHLSMAQWLHNTFATHNNINDEITKCFHHACCNGELRVAKWLHATFNLTVEHAEMNNWIILHDICMRNWLQMAIWLYRTFKAVDQRVPNIINSINLMRERAKRMHMIRWLCITYRLPWIHPLDWSVKKHSTWHHTWQASSIALAACGADRTLLKDVLRRVTRA